ncbi:MAG: hypothetical protein MK052_08825 [Alphaproteobacteria bacterium]|nr:hypothetical protein [Alphaproteobacteria bacterium]
MNKNTRVIYWSILLLSTAAACAPVGRGIQRVGTAVHEESIAVDHRVRDWFDSEDIYGRERNLPDPTTAYCYKTLGEVSCYATPLAGEERRFVGKQEPDPMFTDSYYPVPEQKPEPTTIYLDAEHVVAGELIAEDLPPDGNTYEAPVAVQSQPVTPTLTLKEEPVPAYKQPRELIPVFSEY